MSTKLTYLYVKDYIEKEGYQLLSNTYKNGRSKLKIKCPEEHEYKTTYSNFKLGRRCPICYMNNQKLNYDHVKKYIESFNYKLISSVYKNANTRLLIECDKGHEYKVTYGNFYRGQRCAKCNGGIKLTYEYVKSFIEKIEGYRLLSKTYKNASSKLKIKCPECHEYKVRFYCFKKGARCPICWNESTASKQEIELQDYIESLGYDIIRNDRTQIINPLTGKNLELDIWIPDLNKAIEYNGTYWHSLSKKKQIDKIKAYQCDQKGIDLLIVNEEKILLDNYLEIQKINKWLKKGI